ncbi:uncharacterized protein CLUP02_11730 [Colletotrichum lupini]|uniref:Uncharacterized protein n=1 Tax=Colletotrichum lupini TaxID=145971 RepID=A0A9Q8SZY3_9PEZI|nr:uncharacterized protein CLUP02_11730 [Colletotrichum lupini]UQC86230.1 hypothetical protein CLUP02_11730 [Colletotrichum lupini]
MYVSVLYKTPLTVEGGATGFIANGFTWRGKVRGQFIQTCIVCRLTAKVELKASRQGIGRKVVSFEAALRGRLFYFGSRMANVDVNYYTPNTSTSWLQFKKWQSSDGNYKTSMVTALPGVETLCTIQKTEPFAPAFREQWHAVAGNSPYINLQQPSQVTVENGPFHFAIRTNNSVVEIPIAAAMAQRGALALLSDDSLTLRSIATESNLFMMLQQAPQETSRLSRQVLQSMLGVSSQRIEMALDIIGSVARVEGINGSDIVKKPAVTLHYFCGILREDSAQGRFHLLRSLIVQLLEKLPAERTLAMGVDYALLSEWDFQRLAAAIRDNFVVYSRSGGLLRHRWITVSLHPLHISQQIPEGMTAVFLPATARQERPGLTYVWQPNTLSRRQFDGQRPGSPQPVLFRNPKDD